MGRRGRGEGSLRKRPDGRWEGRYWRETDGRWTRHSVYARTRQEAAQALRQAEGQRDDGVPHVSATAETVASYLTTWLAGVRTQVRPGTHDTYERSVRLYVLPKLGRVRLYRLRPAQLRALYGELLETGLSPKSVRNVHGILTKAFGDAVRDRVLPRNPADQVDAPRVARREMRSLTADQVRQVLVVARGDDLEALYVLALTTGARQGELLALRWEHVDLERRTLRIVASMQQLRGQPVRLVEPKTARGRRTVALSSTAVEALKRRRDAAGPVLPSAFVFPGRNGGPMSADVAWSGWRRLAARAGVPVTRFHDLRHSAASLMLEQGVPVTVVSQTLGHAAASITLDVYSHVSAAGREAAAAAMDEVLGTEKESQPATLSESGHLTPADPQTDSHRNDPKRPPAASGDR